MAQTTGQVPLACGKLEGSTNNADWTDLSGSAQSISGTEQGRNAGEGYTFEGDTAVIAAGKRTPIDLVVQVIYTESDTEAYDIVRAQFETACGGDYYIRWSPKGGDVGEDRLTTAKGILTSFTYPPMDATAGGPIIAGFTLHVPSVTTAAIAS